MRQKCYNRLRRCDDRAEIAQIKAQRDRLTAAMAVCRKDVKTAESVLSRSDKLRENLKLEQEMQAQRTAARRISAGEGALPDEHDNT